ncbi:MAG: hypothetical protein GX786_05370, partial [Clostridiales bacterium]|nr:hypothetical protein [Clostridiales bacterium]
MKRNFREKAQYQNFTGNEKMDQRIRKYGESRKSLALEEEIERRREQEQRKREEQEQQKQKEPEKANQSTGEINNEKRTVAFDKTDVQTQRKVAKPFNTPSGTLNHSGREETAKRVPAFHKADAQTREKMERPHTLPFGTLNHTGRETEKGTSFSLRGNSQGSTALGLNSRQGAVGRKSLPEEENSTVTRKLPSQEDDLSSGELDVKEGTSTALPTFTQLNGKSRNLTMLAVKQDFVTDFSEELSKKIGRPIRRSDLTNENFLLEMEEFAFEFMLKSLETNGVEPGKEMEVFIEGYFPEMNQAVAKEIEVIPSLWDKEDPSNLVDSAALSYIDIFMKGFQWSVGEIGTVEHRGNIEKKEEEPFLPKEMKEPFEENEIVEKEKRGLTFTEGTDSRNFNIEEYLNWDFETEESLEEVKRLYGEENIVVQVYGVLFEEMAKHP